MQRIVDEYGVEHPAALLLRRIDELVPLEIAATLREEYEEARRRYQRAARVREAEVLIRRIEQRADYPDLPHRVYRTLERSRAVVARREEYINGTWNRLAPSRQARMGMNSKNGDA